MEKEIVLYRTFDSPVEANIVKDVFIIRKSKFPKNPKRSV